jgi:hypothetical protein
MRKLFTHSSKVVFDLPEDHEGFVEKMMLGLKRKLSTLNGEDADRNGNDIYFAITPRVLGIQFVGIDSGEVKIDVEGDKMIVRYRLSYLSPFLPFLVLDVFLFWLADKFPSNSEVNAFSVIVAMYLFFWIFGIALAILSFPSIIQNVWYSILNSSKSSVTKIP